LKNETKDQEKTCHTCKHLVEQNKGGLKMSTAPDMLEALETIMDIGDKACRDIARAAIKKAGGEV
jgi:hypothetical protein